MKKKGTLLFTHLSSPQFCRVYFPKSKRKMRKKNWLPKSVSFFFLLASSCSQKEENRKSCEWTLCPRCCEWTQHTVKATTKRPTDYLRFVCSVFCLSIQHLRHQFQTFKGRKNIHLKQKVFACNNNGGNQHQTTDYIVKE